MVLQKFSSEDFVQCAELLSGKNYKQLLLVAAWHFLEMHTRHRNGFQGLSSFPEIPGYCSSFWISHNLQSHQQKRGPPNKMQQSHLGVTRIRRIAKALTHMGVPGQFWLSQAHRRYLDDSSTLLLRFCTPKVSESSPGQMEVDISLLLTAPRKREATRGLQLNPISLKSFPQKLLSSHLVKTSNCR